MPDAAPAPAPSAETTQPPGGSRSVDTDAERRAILDALAAGIIDVDEAGFLLGSLDNLQGDRNQPPEWSA
jgi:hypothetical protein